eukprot:154504-Lingulodinium_polyedra.AAC.1
MDKVVLHEPLGPSSHQRVKQRGVAQLDLCGLHGARPARSRFAPEALRSGARTAAQKDFSSGRAAPTATL